MQNIHAQVNLQRTKQTNEIKKKKQTNEINKTKQTNTIIKKQQPTVHVERSTTQGHDEFVRQRTATTSKWLVAKTIAEKFEFWF